MTLLQIRQPVDWLWYAQKAVRSSIAIPCRPIMFVGEKIQVTTYVIDLLPPVTVLDKEVESIAANLGCAVAVRGQSIQFQSRKAPQCTRNTVKEVFIEVFFSKEHPHSFENAHMADH